MRILYVYCHPLPVSLPIGENPLRRLVTPVSDRALNSLATNKSIETMSAVPRVNIRAFVLFLMTTDRGSL